MGFALGIGGDDPIHEVEELDVPASLILASDNLAVADAANSVAAPCRL